jgi:hypothetical protein
MAESASCWTHIGTAGGENCPENIEEKMPKKNVHKKSP